MPNAVFDSSALLRSLLQGPNYAFADALLARFTPVVPELSRYEIANTLRTCAASSFLTKSEARDLYRHVLDSFDFTRDAGLVTKALDLGLAYRHGSYDMVFVAAAESLDLPLVTADKRLASLANDILSQDVYDVNLSTDPMP